MRVFQVDKIAVRVKPGEGKDCDSVGRGQSEYGQDHLNKQHKAVSRISDVITSSFLLFIKVVWYGWVAFVNRNSQNGRAQWRNTYRAGIAHGWRTRRGRKISKNGRNRERKLLIPRDIYRRGRSLNLYPRAHEP
jgi:uncharacterized C2H2 Zn-finger protein